MYNPIHSDQGLLAIEGSTAERLAFIRKVYGHFLGSLAITAAVTTAVMTSAPVLNLAGRFWVVWMLLYLGLSMCSGWIARQGTGFGYALLGLLSVATGLFFGPTILFYAKVGGVGIVANALILTGSIFTGLTAYVFITRKDFSWMGAGLTAGLFLLIGVGIVSIFVPMGNTTNFLITLAGAVLFCGFILYDTSNILHNYRTDQYVVATVAIYLDFVILFMKILRLLGRGRD